MPEVRQARIIRTEIHKQRAGHVKFDRVKVGFDHVGMVTTEKKPGEIFVEATRVWITNPADHPFGVEWLRFETDSPVTGPLREQSHIGYRVECVEAIREAAKGLKVLLEPFDAGFAVAGFYQLEDGAVIELVTYKDGPSPWSGSTE